MEFCGTDFHAGIGFVRAVTEGTVVALYAPYKLLAEHIVLAFNVEGPVTVAKVRGFMKEMSEAELVHLVQSPSLCKAPPCAKPRLVQRSPCATSP